MRNMLEMAAKELFTCGIGNAILAYIGVREYWVVDVQAAQILAYSIADWGSRRIDQSQALAGLSMATLTEVM